MQGNLLIWYFHVRHNNLNNADTVFLLVNLTNKLKIQNYIQNYTKLCIYK